MQTSPKNDKAITCIDCGSDQVYTAFVRSPKDNNIVMPTHESIEPSDSLYVILRCRDCDSIFLHPYYFQESFGVYDDERYFSGYFPDNIHTGGGPALGSLRFPRYKEWENKRKARSFLKWAGLPQQAETRIVDIGCAKGDFIRGFVDCGCDAYGVDISETMVAEAQRRGLNAHHCSFEDAPFSDEYFDLVVSTEVFEHMAYLGKTLTKINKVLKPDGVLIVQVPNDIEGYRRYFYRKIWWMIPPMHVRYFTRRSVENIFGRHGFTVTSIRTHGSFGRDLGSVTTWLLKKTSIRKILVSKPYIISIRAMSVLFLPIDILLNALRRHREMIIIMHKRQA